MLDPEIMVQKCDILATELVMLNFNQARGSSYTGAAMALSQELQKTIYMWMKANGAKFGENPAMKNFVTMRFG